MIWKTDVATGGGPMTSQLHRFRGCGAVRSVVLVGFVAGCGEGAGLWLDPPGQKTGDGSGRDGPVDIVESHSEGGPADAVDSRGEGGPADAVDSRGEGGADGTDGGREDGNLDGPADVIESGAEMGGDGLRDDGATDRPSERSEDVAESRAEA